MTYKDRLHWTTIIPMDHLENAATKYDFSIRPVYADWNRYTGLNVDSSLDTMMVQEKIEQGKIEGVAKAYQELADITGTGEESEKEIYLKDYIDYYQYSIQLYLPGTHIYRNASWNKKTAVQEQENYAIEKIHDFSKFRFWKKSVGVYP